MRKIVLMNAATAALAMPLAYASAPGDGAAPKAPAKPRVEPVLAGVNLDIPMPQRARPGSEPKYPFAELEVGKAFGIKNKTAKDMGSVISAANRRYSEVKKDDAGNVVYQMKELEGEGGVKMSVPDTTKPEKVATRHFFAVDVTAEQAKTFKGTPNEGIKVLVYRDK